MQDIEGEKTMRKKKYTRILARPSKHNCSQLNFSIGVKAAACLLSMVSSPKGPRLRCFELFMDSIWIP